MDWVGMSINFVAILVGLGIYIGIYRSKWGQKHTEYQYAIMLVAILLACLVGGVLRVIVGWIIA
jgi:hypothetical protein